MKKNVLSILALALVLMALFGYLIGQNGSSNGSSSSSSTDKPSGVDPDLVQYKTYAWDCFDTVTTIVGYAKSGEEFDAVAADVLAELREYHKLFDIYNAYEGVNNIRKINKLYDGEHKVITVDRRIIDMLLYAKEMYVKTGGKMNIAMGSVLSIWHDYRDAAEDNWGVGELPPMADLKEASKHTDINDLIIDQENSTVYLADPKMKLLVGGFGR